MQTWPLTFEKRIGRMERNRRLDRMRIGDQVVDPDEEAAQASFESFLRLVQRRAIECLDWTHEAYLDEARARGVTVDGAFLDELRTVLGRGIFQEETLAKMTIKRRLRKMSFAEKEKEGDSLARWPGWLAAVTAIVHSHLEDRIVSDRLRIAQNSRKRKGAQSSVLDKTVDVGRPSDLTNLFIQAAGPMWIEASSDGEKNVSRSRLLEIATRLDEKKRNEVSELSFASFPFSKSAKDEITAFNRKNSQKKPRNHIVDYRSLVLFGGARFKTENA